MDTDTPPDPDGVPYYVALETLTAPELIAAYLAARDGPILQSQVEARISEMARARIHREQEPGGTWFEPPPITASDAKAVIRKQMVSGPWAALVEDFQARVRAGRIIASFLDLNSPKDGRTDIAAEKAALVSLSVVNRQWQYTLGSGGPVLTDLRYRRAGRVLPRCEMRRLTDEAQGFPEAPDLPAASWVPPVPPAEGWSALEAATALWPALIHMAEREPDRRPASNRAFAPDKREACLRLFSDDLLDHLIFPRDDLVITGRRFPNGPESERVPLSPDYRSDRRPRGVHLDLDILAGTLAIRLPNGEDQELGSVRIERPPPASPTAAPLPPPPAPAPASAPGSAEAERDYAAAVAWVREKAQNQERTTALTQNMLEREVRARWPDLKTDAVDGAVRAGIAGLPGWTKARGRPRKAR